jgi:hypothetical protein
VLPALSLVKSTISSSLVCTFEVLALSSQTSALFALTVTSKLSLASSPDSGTLMPGSQFVYVAKIDKKS